MIFSLNNNFEIKVNVEYTIFVNEFALKLIDDSCKKYVSDISKQNNIYM